MQSINEKSLLILLLHIPNVLIIKCADKSKQLFFMCLVLIDLGKETREEAGPVKFDTWQACFSRGEGDRTTKIASN